MLRAVVSWRAAGPGSGGEAPERPVVDGDSGYQRRCRIAALSLPSEFSADGRERCRALGLVVAGERKRTKDHGSDGVAEPDRAPSSIGERLG
jgi:hypothetical protein